jgi:hypothetical protein
MICRSVPSMICEDQHQAEAEDESGERTGLQNADRIRRDVQDRSVLEKRTCPDRGPGDTD